MDVVKSLELMLDHMVGGGLTSFLFYLKKRNWSSSNACTCECLDFDSYNSFNRTWKVILNVACFQCFRYSWTPGPRPGPGLLPQIFYSTFKSLPMTHPWNSVWRWCLIEKDTDHLTFCCLVLFQNVLKVVEELILVDPPIVSEHGENSTKNKQGWIR